MRSKKQQSGPKETKEQKKKRIENNLEAQKKLKNFTLPIVGGVFVVIFLLIFIASNMQGSRRYAPANTEEQQQ